MWQEDQPAPAQEPAYAASDEHLNQLTAAEPSALVPVDDDRWVEPDLAVAAMIRDLAGPPEQTDTHLDRVFTGRSRGRSPRSAAMQHYERFDGQQAMQRPLALPEPPDAVFCFNDLMAIGAMRACASAGVSIPDGIAVGRFDDIAEGRFSNPTLTTISADLSLLSHEVLRLMMSRVGGPKSPLESVSVPWQLRIRQSTAGLEYRRAGGVRLKVRPNHAGT